MKRTDQPAANYISHSRSHIDVLSHDEVCGMNSNLILLPWSFPPRLLPNNPYARPSPWRHLRRLLGNNILQSRHALQTAFEGFTRRKKVMHILIVLRLAKENCIVGGLVEEWR